MSGHAVGSIRIGCVKYLNAQPLIHGWPGPVVFDHPSVLCQRLADGELEVALVSSFEYLREPIYTIVDGVGVAAAGPVHSVFVAHCGPLPEIAEIALDPASRTSVNLLRVLLAERNLSPRLAAAMPAHEEAARLLIGDQAIRFRAQHGDRYHYWDLAEEWTRLTSLPFVFALWLIRPEVSEPETVASELRALRDVNMRSLDQVISAQTEYAQEFCAFYFRECLSFAFDDEAKAGLRRFRLLCQKHGVLPPESPPLRLA